MQVIIKRIFNKSTQQETGAILTAFIQKIPDKEQKLVIEQFLIQYAFDKLYPNEGLNFYSNIEVDTPSIVVIKGIDNFNHEIIDIAVQEKRISTFQEFIGGFKNRKK